MKAINNFLGTASLWKVYIVMWFITGVVVSAMFYGLGTAVGAEPQKNWTFIMYMKFGAMAGLMFGLMATLMTSMARSSKRFWEYAEVVRKLAEDATTKEQLENIYNNEYKQLRKMSGGTPHYDEVNIIYTILETKHKQFNKKVSVEPVPSNQLFNKVLAKDRVPERDNDVTLVNRPSIYSKSVFVMTDNGPTVAYYDHEDKEWRSTERENFTNVIYWLE